MYLKSCLRNGCGGNCWRRIQWQSWPKIFWCWGWKIRPFQPIKMSHSHLESSLPCSCTASAPFSGAVGFPVTRSCPIAYFHVLQPLNLQPSSSWSTHLMLSSTRHPPTTCMCMCATPSLSYNPSLSASINAAGRKAGSCYLLTSQQLAETKSQMGPTPR